MNVRYSIDRIRNLGVRAYLKNVRPIVGSLSNTESSDGEFPLSVLIPCIEKDLPVLPHVIYSIKRFIAHPISEIVVVGPSSSSLEELCKRDGCRFVNENQVLPIKKSDIAYVSNGIDRSGWLFQQLLKLAGDSICVEEHWLVVDSDTVFTRTQRFINSSKTVFNTSDEYHLPYRRAFARLLGYVPTSPVSFVAHHMLFERQIISRLRNDIERRHNKPWYQSIIDCVDTSEASGFSEYETYGNFVYRNYRGRMEMEYWFHYDLKRLGMDTFDVRNIPKEFSRFKTVSFQHYNTYN